MILSFSKGTLQTNNPKVYIEEITNKIATLCVTLGVNLHNFSTKIQINNEVN